MKLDDALDLIEGQGVRFRIPNMKSNVVSKTAMDQEMILLPMTFETVYLYEYQNSDELLKDKQKILKRATKLYLDGIPVEIICNNLYLLYFKHVTTQGESETERILKHLFVK